MEVLYTPTAIGIFDDVPVDYWAADWIEQRSTKESETGVAQIHLCIVLMMLLPVTRWLYS